MRGIVRKPACCANHVMDAAHAGVREEMRTRLFDWALSRRTRTTVTDEFIERLTGGAKARGYRFGEW